MTTTKAIWIIVILAGLATHSYGQQLDQFAWDAPVHVSGKISTTSTIYWSDGDSQRDPFYWLVNGNVKGITVH